MSWHLCWTKLCCKFMLNHNPFTPNRLFHSNKLDQSISHLRYVTLIVFISFITEISVFKALITRLSVFSVCLSSIYWKLCINALPFREEVRSKLKLSQPMRLWYLSHERPAKDQASLPIRAVSPEPSLFAHVKYGSRHRGYDQKSDI